MTMRMAIVVILASAVAVLGIDALSEDDVAAGERAWREKSWGDALHHLAAAADESDAAASAELLFDVALAAIAAKRPVDAEIAAEKSVARGGERFVARRDFIVGHASWLRGADAAAMAARPESAFLTYDAAIAHFDQARTAWEKVVASGADRPAELEDKAARNAERARLRIALLQRERDAARDKKKASPDRPEQPEEQPESPPEAADEAPDVQGDGVVELDPDAVARLFELMRNKERERDDVRRADRTTGRGAMSEDW